MKLNYSGDREYIKLAVAKANEILNNPEFYLKIESHKPFDNTNLNPKEISDIIRNATQEVNVGTYWYLNPFKPNTCVNAKTLNHQSIKLNTRCFSKELKKGVNTLIHESIHAADFIDERLDFTHADNANNGEENNTAPWAIGKIAESFV